MLRYGIALMLLSCPHMWTPCNLSSTKDSSSTSVRGLLETVGRSAQLCTKAVAVCLGHRGGTLKQKPIVCLLSAAGSALLLVAACGQDSAESQDVSDDSETHSPAHQCHAEVTVHTSDDVKPRNELENERVDLDGTRNRR